MRLGSNGILSKSGFIRSSAITFAQPSSRACLDGHSIQE
jgi:hypothetical protein